MSHKKLKDGSLLFAPMDGITDQVYMSIVRDAYQEWDFLFTPFLRVPSSGFLNSKMVIEHLGDPTVIDSTVLQILCAERSNVSDSIKAINDLRVPWLDLNFGCPSKKVVSHNGGAYILDKPDEMRRIIAEVRKNYTGHLSVKMRLGFKSVDYFEENLRVIEGEGCDAVIIHARTRDQFYSGNADWSYIEMASDQLKIPVIGNGDIFTKEDIEKRLSDGCCHSLMVGRGALTSPWLAREHRFNRSMTATDKERLASSFFHLLEEGYRHHLDERAMLKRFKGIATYIVIGNSVNGDEIKDLLRSSALEEFYQWLALIRFK